MKIFTSLIISLLALTVYKIQELNQEEEDYGKRLGKIAEKINSMDLTWKAVTPEKLKDLTIENVMNLVGTKMNNNFGLKDVSYYYNMDINGLPEAFDSRLNWPNCSSIKEVRDQGGCGSCWAFGAVESMSDRWCIASNQTDQKRISSEDLLACCFECGHGCNGGYAGAAWNHWMTSGIVSGGLYGDNKYCLPYSIKSQRGSLFNSLGVKTPNCTQKCNSEYPKTYFNDKTYGKNAYYIQGELKMMAEIFSRGPIEVAFVVYEDFIAYKSGIYQHTTGKFLGGHSVKIIGWGVEDNTDYWIAVNSWNEGWGDQGTFKIVRGINDCGIENFAFAGVADWKE